LLFILIPLWSYRIAAFSSFRSIRVIRGWLFVMHIAPPLTGRFNQFAKFALFAVSGLLLFRTAIV